jgi:hypothetical protein
MRKALNDNPVAQIVVLALLGIVVAFMLLTRVAHRSGSSAPATTTTESSTASSPTTGTLTTPTTPSAGATPPATTVPGTTGSPSGSEAMGEFVAGPGLPASVVHAYKSDKTVVLLVLRRRGIDDRELRAQVENLRGSDVALFVTNAGRIARYSRITQGVNVDRVPALVVLRPQRLAHGAPVASVRYGYRGPESVVQAVRDALYKGPTNLPYYPK